MKVGSSPEGMGGLVTGEDGVEVEVVILEVATFPVEVVDVGAVVIVDVVVVVVFVVEVVVGAVVEVRSKDCPVII